MSTHYRLSFAIGPVQSFVAQARRTRDLWTGSWLLSFLAENALIAAEEKGGEAIIPFRDGQEKKLTSILSAVGGIPNRFEIAFDSEELAVEAGEASQRAFANAWSSVASIVWDKYVERIANDDSRMIWKRQVDTFWETSWVVTREGESNQIAGLALNRRKQFRNVVATIEPGTKCSMIKELQEISGFEGISGRKKQQEFWEEFRDGEKVGTIDLKADERLCSIGVIKRFYPDVIETHLEAFVGRGYSATLGQQSRWPSMSFFAALPWLKEIEELSKSEPNIEGAASKFASDARKSEMVRGEKVHGYWDSETVPANDFGLGDWATIDATAWHPTGLANNMVGFSQSRVRQLGSLQQKVFRLAKNRKPLPYYALLLADGDSMGKLLSALNDSTKLSSCLSEFSSGVNQIISPQNGNGRVVYSGGDDVFGLVSAESALDVAKQLSDSYRAAFKDTKADKIATLSVAIVYSHFKFPLASTIRVAHTLLDDIAKDRTGRDSIALGLVQGCGLNAVWSSPWESAFPKTGKDYPQMLDWFASGDQERVHETATFNSSYLQVLRRQYSRLLPRTAEIPGAFQTTNLGQDVLLQLAHSEYRRRLSSNEQSTIVHATTKLKIEGLMSLSYPRRRSVSDKSVEYHFDRDKFGFDGWKIARFLKQVKEGEIVDHE